MAALPYMQLYVADYLADTSHLTTEEHGAYLLLLFSYWQTGKPLRSDRLATVARMSNDRWISVEKTLSEFFRLDIKEGYWMHLRVEADLHKINSKSKQASEAGKKSALARSLAKRAMQTDVPTTVATDDQRIGNHTRSRDTDTDTDTDKDQNQEPLSSKPDEEGKKPKKKIDETPYQEILDRYQKICGGIFLGAEVLNEKRKRNIKRTYDMKVRDKYPFHDLAFWEKYLAHCVKNKHWCGENDRAWKADLEFVTREANVLKVLGV